MHPDRRGLGVGRASRRCASSASGPAAQQEDMQLPWTANFTSLWIRAQESLPASKDGSSTGASRSGGGSCCTRPGPRCPGSSRLGPHPLPGQGTRLRMMRFVLACLRFDLTGSASAHPPRTPCYGGAAVPAHLRRPAPPSAPWACHSRLRPIPPTYH